MALPFARDRFTVIGYGLLGVFAFGMALLGPAMPLLRDDLGISRAVGGLHFSALALGSVVSGFTSARIARRIGRRAAILAGGTGVAAGAAVIAVGRHAAVTIAGAFLLGYCGNVLLAVVQGALSDRHGAARAVALGEANALTGFVFFVPGLVISAFESGGPGWRWAFLAPAVLWALAVIPARRVEIPEAADVGGVVLTGRMPGGFRLMFWALVLGVAVEWCIAGWGAGYLVDEGGVGEAAAAALVVLFYLAMAVGRVIGSLVARRVDAITTVPWSAAIAGAGFLMFWLAPGPAAMTGGLVVSGLGVANMFPYLTSGLFALAPGRTDDASAMVSVAGGVAVFTAPLTLGAVADASGLRVAFALVPVLIVGVAVLSVLPVLKRRRDRPARPRS